MKGEYFDVPSVVVFAEEVLSMYRENVRLQEENEELRGYRKKYLDELNSSIAHNKRMTFGLLELALKPGVLEAVATANASTNVEEDK